jgi:hypothetical protein
VLKSDDMKQKMFASTLIAYYPDTWYALVTGTPLEQIAVQTAKGLGLPVPEPEVPPGAMGGALPPADGMGGPPPGMPPDMGGMGGGMGGPPPDMGGMPQDMGGPMPGAPMQEMPQGMGMPGPDGVPLQPPAIPMPMGGGIPPEMQGQMTPEGSMGLPPNFPPELWAQIMGQPLPPGEQLEGMIPNG